MPQVDGSTAATAVATEPEQLTLFSMGVDVSALRRERAAIAGRKRSQATVKAYTLNWKYFLEWCTKELPRQALPATPDTVGLYAIYLMRQGRMPSTIAQRLAAIRAKHLAAGFPTPVDDDVREILADIGRKLGTAPRYAKAPITVEELRRMLAALDGTAHRGIYTWEFPGGPVLAVRDRAILLLGFASGLRRSEIAGLDVADVEEVDEGLILQLRRSKTDQDGKGREVPVHRGQTTCPVRALAEWLVERGNWAGPLFSFVSRKGAITHRRLSGEAISLVVKAAAKRAQLDVSRYSGHSLRAGCATASAKNHATETAIMTQTGHKSPDMVRRYIRHGTLFAVNTLAGVL